VLKHTYPYFRYNFSKIAQYKQLTLEEAEEKMNKRKTSATGYERWMMKAAANGPAAFGSDMKKLEAPNGGENDNARPKKGKNSEEGNNSDKGEEDEEEPAHKNKLGLTKKGMDDEEEGGKDLDFDLDDEIEKGLPLVVLGLQHLFPPVSHKMIFA
jgi:transcription initiation factor TFIIF subunit alpha